MKVRIIFLSATILIAGCGAENHTEWYAIGANADGVPCKSNLATGVETPLTADELKPCDAEIKLPVYQMEGGVK